MKKLLLLAALVTAPLAAHADPARAHQVHVSSLGLDLNNPADAAVMIRRIESAVRVICVAPGYAAGRSTAGCIRDVTRETVKGMRIPELTLAFEQRSTPPSSVARG